MQCNLPLFFREVTPHKVYLQCQVYTPSVQNCKVKGLRARGLPATARTWKDGFVPALPKVNGRTLGKRLGPVAPKENILRVMYHPCLSLLSPQIRRKPINPSI